jgi:hypothetical protein
MTDSLQMTDSQLDVLLKAWDRYQSLIAALGDSCWKIRSVFYTVSFALIAAGFSSNVRALYLLVPFAAIGFCFLEAGYQHFQHQYIEKSVDIERTINDVLANEAAPRFPDRIATSVDAPTIKSLLWLFKPRLYLFWLSYLLLAVIPIVFFVFKATKSRF